MACTAIAAIALPFVAANAPGWLRAVSALFGIGMGFANTASILAVQTSVGWEQRGIATAGTMFFRTIGGAVAVGVMGGVLVAALAEDGSLPKDAASRALNREGIGELGPDVARRVAQLLEGGLATVFWMITALACAAFVAAMFFPELKRAPEAKVEGETKA
jgi:MFS family permease